jgi:hypothetical protein
MPEINFESNDNLNYEVGILTTTNGSSGIEIDWENISNDCFLFEPYNSSYRFCERHANGIIWKKSSINYHFYEVIKKRKKYFLSYNIEDKNNYCKIFKMSNNKKEKFIEIKKVLACSCCFQIHKIKNMISTENGYVCRECATKEFKKCYNCNHIHYKGRMYRSKLDNKYYCKECYNKKYFTCAYCGDEKLIDRKCQDLTICIDCFEKYFIFCSACGEAVLSNKTIKYKNKIYCYFCGEKYLKIKKYNYIPKNFKYNKLKWENELYMGIELEIELLGVDRNKYEENAEKLTNFLSRKKTNKHFYIKHDGTIKGFELVSHPLSLQYIHKNIDYYGIFKWLRNNGYTSYKSGNCGLHIHLNKDFFKDFEAQRLRLFFSTNFENILKFSKRDVNRLNYCKFENLNPKIFLQSGLIQKDKYQAIRMNPSGKNTIEMRIFRGTLYYPRFLATLQFCDAISHYIKEIGVNSVINKKSWDLFIDWCRQKNNYIHFLKYISNLETTTNLEI